MHNPFRLLAPVLAVPLVAVAVSAQTVIVTGTAGSPTTVNLGSGARTTFSASFRTTQTTSKGLLNGIKSLSFDAKAQKELGEKVELAAKKTAKPQKPLPPPPSPYTDSEIIAMAKELAKQYKGSPWSFTEYNSVLYPTLDHLRQQGVPERQIALFQKTCDEFPGRPFNPWSGD